MLRALELARQGFPAPNPHVGAVIVQNGQIISEGYHNHAGGEHAEAAAIRTAGAEAINSTLYVTLEPCTHFGRTPPCVDSIIKAEIARVVISALDPNPKVHGNGVDKLIAAGIEVVSGLFERESKIINKQFEHFHKLKRPLITLKAAMSLDGKIATYDGDSKWITSELSRNFTHKMRAERGAALVGKNTLVKDNPKLTARVQGVVNQPVRIVLDSNLSCDPNAAIFDESARTIIASVDTTGNRNKTYSFNNAEFIFTDAVNNQVCLKTLVRKVWEMDITGILVEGGGEVHASFLEAQLADEIMFFYAPIIIGGRDAISAVEGNGIDTVSHAWSVENISLQQIGVDYLIIGDIKYRNAKK